MFRFSVLIVCCASFLFQQGESLDAPDAASTQQSQESSPKEQLRIREKVADIMGIQSQMGGGVAETLGDLSLEMPGQGTEGDLQEGSRKDPALSRNEQFKSILAAQFLADESSGESKQASSFSLLKNQPSLPAESQELVREAARKLEEAAAILEQVSDYDRADQIRQNATELWKSARN